jgi:hypothetical protein
MQKWFLGWDVLVVRFFNLNFGGKTLAGNKIGGKKLAGKKLAGKNWREIFESEVQKTLIQPSPTN